MHRILPKHTWSRDYVDKVVMQLKLKDVQVSLLEKSDGWYIQTGTSLHKEHLLDSAIFMVRCEIYKAMSKPKGVNNVEEG